MGLLDLLGLSGTARSVESTAQSLTSTLDESKLVMAKVKAAADKFESQGAVASGPGYASGQKSVSRDVFVQALIEHYDTVFNAREYDDWHILVLYDQLNVLGTFYDVVTSGGSIVTGPIGVNNPTAHLYVSKGWGQIGKWGYKVYVFKRGQVNNLGDGGWINWGMMSSTMRYEKNGNKVNFSTTRR